MGTLGARMLVVWLVWPGEGGRRHPSGTGQFPCRRHYCYQIKYCRGDFVVFGHRGLENDPGWGLGYLGSFSVLVQNIVVIFSSLVMWRAWHDFLGVLFSDIIFDYYFPDFL